MGHSNPFPPPSYIREMSTIYTKMGKVAFFQFPTRRRKEGRKEERRQSLCLTN
jgi:hypothetical protein